MEPRSFFVPGGDGHQIHVLEWSTEGVPLIFVHGFGNTARIWDDAAAVVAPHYRTIAMDQRGHGDSDHDPEHRYAYDDLARDLEAVVETLQIERFVLVGHSLGGRTAMTFAEGNAERLAGLVIVDTGPEHDPRGSSRIRNEVEQRGDGTVASLKEYEGILAHNYPASSPEVIRRMAAAELRERDDGRWERKLDPTFFPGRADMDEAAMEAHERETSKRLWAVLEKIPCPTLVIRGAASDILGPDVADRMVEEALPNGTLAVVGQASHSVMTDNPEGFNAALAAFALGS
ncbi:MAG: alpha/beta hydrolase [Deltaproteobacteria bacterium]|nr:alpha/beta hydrolase [Deltaproteobacteria bacterium]MBW2393275.1 alpha/beta hydrolase [Deltaproteobacteria bacterium]